MRCITSVAFVTTVALSACNRQSTSSAQGTAAVSDARQVGSVVDAIPCGDLAKLSLPNTIITVAEGVGAGAFVPPPDLRAFGQRGGKLLMWHGWSDGSISPRNSVDYHTQVVATIGERQARDQVRLFMAPGVQHCSGGEGASQVDYLSVLEQWVENGKTPERIVASRPLEGGGMRTRPLCAYPQIAAYKCNGSTDDAGNFVCQAP